MKKLLFIPLVFLAYFAAAQDTIKPKNIVTGSIRVKVPVSDTSTKVAVFDASGVLKYNRSAGGGSIDTTGWHMATVESVNTKLSKGDSTIYLTPYDAAATYQPIGAYLTDSTRFAQYDSLTFRKVDNRVYLKDSTDSISIGTNTPVEKFTVDGNAAITGGLYFTNMDDNGPVMVQSKSNWTGWPQDYHQITSSPGNGTLDVMNMVRSDATHFKSVDINFFEGLYMSLNFTTEAYQHTFDFDKDGLTVSDGMTTDGWGSISTLTYGTSADWKAAYDERPTGGTNGQVWKKVAGTWQASADTGKMAFDSLTNIYTEDQVDALLAGKAPAFTATTNRYVWKYISGAWRAWPDSVGTAGVTGSGTTGYLTKWNSSTALADSPLYTNGTFVSLGTTSQVVNEKLHISAGNGWGAVIENASTGYGEPALSVVSSGAGPTNGIAIKSDCGGSSVNYSFWGENGYLYNKHGLSLGQVVPDSLLTVNGGGHIGGGLKVGAKVYFTGLTHQDTATHVLTYNIGTGEVKASSTISVNTTGSSGSCTGNAATVTPNIWQPITGSYASANTFSFSGTAKDALLVTKSLFQAVSSNGATLYAGYIKSAGESGGTVTCTVVSVNALAAGAKNFYVAYNEKITGLENNYRFTNEVPGVITADASYYVGRFYMNVPDTMLIVSTQPDCMTAASGGSPDATYNIYDNTTAIYNTAISMSTNATLADQVPATMYKVAPGHAITLRWLTSAGTVKCSDCSVKITYIPTSILRSK